MKIIERNESRYVLEPLKQYLENEGIKADIQVEWKSGRKYGPCVLIVEDSLYEDAIRVLDNIDKSEIDDGIPLTTRSGRTIEQVKHRYDVLCKWAARILLVLVIIGVLFIVVYYN